MAGTLATWCAVGLLAATVACGSQEPASDVPVRPARCDAPELRANWEACRAQTDRASCVAAGGTWRNYGPDYLACNCPTGQLGCPCTSDDQCLGNCSSYGKSDPDCADVTWGTCSSNNGALGCLCYWWYGKFQAMCVD